VVTGYQWGLIIFGVIILPFVVLGSLGITGRPGGHHLVDALFLLGLYVGCASVVPAVFLYTYLSRERLSRFAVARPLVGKARRLGSAKVLDGYLDESLDVLTDGAGLILWRRTGPAARRGAVLDLASLTSHEVRGYIRWTDLRAVRLQDIAFGPALLLDTTAGRIRLLARCRDAVAEEARRHGVRVRP
jgi:hypothetical protein